MNTRLRAAEEEHGMDNEHGMNNKGMSEILRMLADKKKRRPWDPKPTTKETCRLYTVEMEPDGRYKVIESEQNATTHHSNFANEGDAEAWATYRRDSAAYWRKYGR
jgi:hypothetical protein